MAPDYRYPTELLAGTLLRRYKRFLADVELEDGARHTVHCANPGSMQGLVEPGRPVRVRDTHDPRRKLPMNLEQIRPGRAWVCVNTALPNRVVAAALARGGIEPLRDYERIRPEVADGQGSRFDFLLEGDAGRCWVEVKNVTLKKGREARFPDAVTERGRKHLRHLTALRGRGDRAVMIYFVSRADADAFRPAWEVDSAYAQALTDAVAGGVEVMPVAGRVSAIGVSAAHLLPYDLGHA